MVTVVNKTIGTGGDFTTFAAWESATDIDISTATGTDEQHNGRLLETLDEGALFAGATTDEFAFRRLTFDSARYDPVADTGVGLDSSVAFTLANLSEGNVHITGILLRNTDTANANCIGGTGVGSVIEECTAKRIGGSASNGEAVSTTFGAVTDFTIRNCVIIGDGLGSTVQGMGLFSTDPQVDNCAIYNFSGIGLDLSGSVTYIARLEITNVISMGNGGNDFDAAGNGSDFTFCLSEDTSASGFSDSFSSQTLGDIFTDAANDDLTLVGTGNATDNGKDQSARFTIDLDGTTRTGDWDMGAYDKVVSAGGAVQDPIGMGIIPFAR